jgi:tripartite-type tricarboxylate transporter receptor subunit TctC
MTFMTRLAAAFFCLAAAGLGTAEAQRAGAGTLRIVVPFPAGGTADVIARLVGQEMANARGQPLLVENRPGAGTIIGTEAVARSAPDGNTLLLMANSFVINPSVRLSLPYDPLTSFEPICRVVDSPQVVVVNSSAPYRNLADLFAAAKARPGEFSLATVGPATTQHIAGEMLKRAAGVDLTYVPFTGGAPAVNAILGGHVTAVLANYNEVMEQLRAGSLRPLAVTTRQRIDALPDVPTVTEGGYGDFEAIAFFGLVAPAKTPRDAVTDLVEAARAAVAVPEVQAKLTGQGLYPTAECGEAFAAYLRRQNEAYARAVRDANIKPN